MDYYNRRATSLERRGIRKLHLNTLNAQNVPQDYGAIYKQKARFGSADINNKGVRPSRSRGNNVDRLYVASLKDENVIKSS